MDSSLKLTRSKATIKATRLHEDTPKSVNHFYMVTIAKHQVKDYVHKSNLVKVVSHLKLKHDSLHVIKYCYELSKCYSQLHFHGIFRLSHRITYKDNNSVLGFRVQWKPVYDWQGAIDYIDKECYNQFSLDQILSTNYYRHHYGFI